MRPHAGPARGHEAQGCSDAFGEEKEWVRGKWGRKKARTLRNLQNGMESYRAFQKFTENLCYARPFKNAVCVLAHESPRAAVTFYPHFTDELTETRRYWVASKPVPGFQSRWAGQRPPSSVLL